MKCTLRFPWWIQYTIIHVLRYSPKFQCFKTDSSIIPGPLIIYQNVPCSVLEVPYLIVSWYLLEFSMFHNGKFHIFLTLNNYRYCPCSMMRSSMSYCLLTFTGIFHVPWWEVPYLLVSRYLPELSLFHDEKFHISLPHVEQFLSLLFTHPSHHVRKSKLSHVL